MADLVAAQDIESIVGRPRHGHQHLARAVSAERRVYVLHSARCLDSGIDLRSCLYSTALDQGIEPEDWAGFEDQPVVVAIIRDRLFPVIPRWIRNP